MTRSALVLLLAALGASPAAAQESPAQPSPAQANPAQANPAQASPSQEGPPQEAPAQPRPIRNAPSPRAVALVSYIYAASNVCGYRIGAPEFKALLATQNLTPEELGPRGPFSGRITSTFTMMSNQMAQNREQACVAVAGEYGPEGSLARNVLQPGDPSGR